MYNAWYTVGLATMAALLLIEHWFPWPARLHRLCAYPLGVVAMFTGMAVWLIQSGYADIMTALVPFALVAGITVYGAYAVDWLVAKIRRAWKAERMLRDG